MPRGTQDATVPVKLSMGEDNLASEMQAGIHGDCDWYYRSPILVEVMAQSGKCVVFVGICGGR